jgi:hypothetical protein
MLQSLYTRNIDVNIAYRKEGDWDKARIILQELPYQVRRSVLKGQRAFANIFLKAIKAKIDSGGGGEWAPSTSEHYKRFKEGKGKSIGDLLSFYGDYKRNIKLVQTDKGITVGVNKNVRNSTLNPTRNITIAQYAAVLEHGSFWQNIPARPLWSSTFSDLGGKRRVLKEVSRGISEDLLKKYGINISTTIK